MVKIVGLVEQGTGAACPAPIQEGTLTDPSDNVIRFPVSEAQRRSSSTPETTPVRRLTHEGSTRIPDYTGPVLSSPGPKRSDAGNLSVSDIWDAVNQRRIAVHYQPQYDMRTGRAVAAEALVRIVDTDGAIIYPDQFIDLVEDSDLCVPVGRALLARVCADIAACRKAGIPLQRIAVNLSARQLESDTGFPDLVDAMIERNGLRYEDLEFELTERQVLEPACEGRESLIALADRGARIALDDFGMGYSSVVYLTDLPVSSFKLDRVLIARLLEDDRTQSVVTHLLELAANLGLEVVAEGVETHEQHTFLTNAGCHFAQGFGFAMPLAFDDLQQFLRNLNQTSRLSV